MDLITLALTLALAYWGRRLGGSPGRPRWLRHLVYPLLVGWGIGALGTAYMLVRAFDAASRGDPSQKATILAQSISEAMNCAAFEALVLLAATVLLLVIQLRKPKPPVDPAGHFD